MTKFKLSKTFLITLLISGQDLHAQELDPSILSKIDNAKLLLIDWNIHTTPKNNYVFQDFTIHYYEQKISINRKEKSRFF